MPYPNGAIDAEDKDYICTLTEKNLEKAKRELNEDPKERLSAVKALRDWIKAQPHLACRNDTIFLLRVLRTTKFSQLKAREKIEMILDMRTKMPQYVTNIDILEPGIQRYIEKGIFVPLPGLDREGRGVLLARVSMIDLNDPLLNIVNEMRAGLAMDQALRENDENMMVNGMVLIVDMTGITLKHFTRESREEQQKKSKFYQDCSLGRLKAFHYYNIGTMAELFMTLVKALLRKKFMERIHIHDTMESLYKAIPMEMWPDEYLPDDYNGPSAGPIQKLVENLKKQLNPDPDFRERLLRNTSDEYKIDLSKKDQTVPQESFRRLNID